MKAWIKYKERCKERKMAKIMIEHECNPLKVDYDKAAHRHYGMIIGRWQRAILDRERREARLASRSERHGDITWN